MKRILLSAALVLGFATPVLAAATAPPPGSIAITYTNAAGVLTYAPYATISNAEATAFITWCEAQYASIPTANTPGGCFNAWANDYFHQTIAAINSYRQGQAATAAANASTPTTITPAQ
jgi:hypothetical protein